MNNVNGELLEDVGGSLLQAALDQINEGPIDGELQKQVIEVADRLLKMDQIDNDLCVAREKLEFEKEKQRSEQELRTKELELKQKDIELREKELEAKQKDQKWNWGVEIGKVAIVAVFVPLLTGGLDRRFKVDFAKACMNWENTGKSFTSEPGRAIRSIFNFR